VAGGVVEGQKGYFIRPTIVRDITEGARLVDEEQFGPVLPVIKYSDVQDAVRRANASPYGLGGSVWSSSSERAVAVASNSNVAQRGSAALRLAPSIPSARQVLRRGVRRGRLAGSRRYRCQRGQTGRRQGRGAGGARSGPCGSRARTPRRGCCMHDLRAREANSCASRVTSSRSHPQARSRLSDASKSALTAPCARL
jgi:hypothetical protein